ncbi:Vegetative incompatibility protein HET-E-1 [Trametes pubescens]|uniref:Vegetative incompatibility protein HET-E-1 n=1 Tax=Trametes pubescens TaxID=154538 RepID=A0A1M2VNG8_TRAPU|nr:Vegetative incompatibility protein HET-E-1 [Trametes pubescens]
MRVIDTRTGLFVWVNNPHDIQYAVLSHVWGPDEELSYEGLLAIHCAARDSPNPRWYIFDAVPAKVKEFCAFAQRQGFHFAWIDTCCIDKSSSAELEEAINSMYRW